MNPSRDQDRVMAYVASIGVGLLLSVMPGHQASGADAPTLEKAYQEARKLAATPQSHAQAIEKYLAVIRAHQANEEFYRASLRQLARSYEEAGRIEDGVRFFAGLTQRRMSAGRDDDPLREIIQQYRLKHPELLARIAEELGLVSRPSAAPIPSPGAIDLARAILQRDDKVLREKSLQRVARMLAPQSPDRDKFDGLIALRRAISAKFDRARFRPLVLSLLKSSNPQIRGLALDVVPGAEATTDDLPKIIELAKDPSPNVRARVGLAMILTGKGQEKERIAPTLVRLLRDTQPQVIEQTIRCMWGEYSSPDLDQQLIDLAGQPPLHHNAVYFGLSTMRSKSPAVCRRLVEELNDTDWNNSGRAAWGLGFGIAGEAKPLVEEGLLKALPEETNGYTRGQEFQALRGVASEKSRRYLKSVVESPQETEDCRRAAREILAEIDKRR
jgi:hypothetical protein